MSTGSFKRALKNIKTNKQTNRTKPAKTKTKKLAFNE